MNEREIPDDGSYYAEGTRVQKAPTKGETNDGKTTWSIGFPVCDIWEGVKDGEKAAEFIADAMNDADRSKRPPNDAETERVARAFEPHLWSRIDRDLNVEHLTGAATHARNNSMDRARAAIIALRGGE